MTCRERYRDISKCKKRLETSKGVKPAKCPAKDHLGAEHRGVPEDRRRQMFSDTTVGPEVAKLGSAGRLQLSATPKLLVAAEYTESS